MPVIFYFPSPSLTLQCPSCGLESVVTENERINRRVKVICGKCKKTFVIKPNVRRHYRRDVDIACKLSLKPVEDKKTRGSLKTKVVDVSESGLGVSAPLEVINHLELEEGKFVYACFSIPKGLGEILINSKCVVKSILKQTDKKSARIGLEVVDHDGSVSKKLGFFLWN